MRNRFATIFGLAVVASCILAGQCQCETTSGAKAEETACYGTAVEFVSTPVEAAKLAAKDKKLVFVLHVSGHFEDPHFTWNNAEALRANALANDEVGKFINKYFVASFQRVGSFRINNGQKQGGNVATYFCAPDGRVLHAIAGPVDAKTLLAEAKWVIAESKEAISESKGDATKFKESMRKRHAERLEEEYGARVTPVLKDQSMQNLRTALAYRDAEGRHLAPVLPLPPIENLSQVKKQLPNTAKVHQLLAAHATMKIENLYGVIFEGILGEKVTTKPVQGDTPFPGRK